MYRADHAIVLHLLAVVAHAAAPTSESLWQAQQQPQQLSGEEAALLGGDDACLADPTGEGCAVNLLQRRGGASAVAAEEEEGGSCSVYGCTEYDASQSCQCNAACKQHSNCCADFVPTCLPCKQVCAYKGHTATCGARMQFVKKKHSKSLEACKIAYDVVIGQCKECGECHLDECSAAEAAAEPPLASPPPPMPSVSAGPPDGEAEAAAGNTVTTAEATTAEATTAEATTAEATTAEATTAEATTADATTAEATTAEATTAEATTAEATTAEATTAAPGISDEASGFCCYKGAGTDICGGCFPDAMAEHGSWCANEDKCGGPADSGGCGGTWCQMKCVYKGSDPNDVCGTAYRGAIAAPEDFCGHSEDKCSGCGGTWCGMSLLPPSDAHTSQSLPADDHGEAEDTDPEDSYPGAWSGEEEFWPEGYFGESLAERGEQRQALTNSSAAEDVASPDFCCFAGDGNDKCGSCYPGAKAQPGDYCASKANCGGCENGTWCSHQCVLAASDPNDVCNNAYSIAESDNWCAQSEEKCNGCAGTWCGMTANATNAA